MFGRSQARPRRPIWSLNMEPVLPRWSAATLFNSRRTNARRSAFQHLLLPHRPRDRRLERCLPLRHSERSRSRYSAAGVRQLAASRVPSLHDDLLTRVLDDVYDSFEQRTGFFNRFRRANSANRLHTVLLEVMELTERADNRYQVPERHVRRPSLSSGRCQGWCPRLQGPRQPEDQYRRGSLPLHGRSVQPESRLLPRIRRGHHSCDRD